MAWKLEEISEGEEEWVGERLREGWGGVGCKRGMGEDGGWG